ncbi:MAG: cytochrome c biogenesis protein CcsA [Calditrichaeota bacterium]|nr:cytochrome c biogenesis protein CcsA [Calditrichota bacterium]MBT7616593.1 cytochrome c biogenesis protein CcsA [Calditrichota bacterium]MBT7789958.1 cytochrome c biogenesis protein CcsA [Calditrichota bacterium]
MSRPDAIFYSLAFYAYLAAFGSFIFYVASSKKWLGTLATTFTIIGVTPHTVAFFLRWSVQGHVPLVNMYEYMGMMAWMVMVGLLFYIFRYKNTKIGVFVSPIAVVLLVVASLLPSDVNRQLMPALQSTWLAIHVSMAALGSGAFLISFAASALFLLSFDEKPSKRNDAPRVNWGAFLLFWIVIPVFIGIVVPLIGLFSLGGNPELSSGSKITIFSINLGSDPLYWGRFIIGLGMGMIISSFLWPLAHGKLEAFKGKFQSGSRFFIVHVLAVLVSAIVVGFMNKGGLISLTPRSYFKIFEFFGPVLIISWVMTPIMSALLLGSGENWWRKIGISRPVFEELSTSAVAIGYPLYTIGALFAGAIWAEQAWGTWWSWDPKEVGALIIWLFYTGFLHARHNRQWRGEPAAILIVLGMVMLFVSFFGNYFFGGMHSFEVT